MEYIINFNKKTNSIKVTADNKEFIPKLTELLEDYKDCLITDINISFTVDEMNKTVCYRKLGDNQMSNMRYDTLSPEEILIWFHNACAMLENVEYTETVICYDEGNLQYGIFDEVVKNQLNK